MWELILTAIEGLVGTICHPGMISKRCPDCRGRLPAPVIVRDRTSYFRCKHCGHLWVYQDYGELRPVSEKELAAAAHSG